MKKPQNEPVLTYKKGSEERKALDKALAELSSKVTDVPLRIGNEKITNKMERKQVMVGRFCSCLLYLKLIRCGGFGTSYRLEQEQRPL